MKLAIGLLLLSLTACASFPPPPPRLPVDPAVAQMGLQLMQMGQPYTLPAQPTQTNCLIYPPNKITGVAQVVCH